MQGFPRAPFPCRLVDLLLGLFTLVEHSAPPGKCHIAPEYATTAFGALRPSMLDVEATMLIWAPSAPAYEAIPPRLQTGLPHDDSNDQNRVIEDSISLLVEA